MFLLYPKGWEALAGLYLRQTDVASVTPGGAWLAQGHRQDLIVLLLVGGGVGGRGAEEKSSSYEKKPRGRDGQTEPADRRAVSQAAGEGSSSAEPSAGKAVRGAW